MKRLGKVERALVARSNVPKCKKELDSMRETLVPNSMNWTRRWKLLITLAQKEKVVTDVHGKNHDRVPMTEWEVCRDCLTKKGFLHVPGCCQELCPVCKTQIIFCGHVEGI